jgi:hypothetical protein
MEESRGRARGSLGNPRGARPEHCSNGPTTPGDKNRRERPPPGVGWIDDVKRGKSCANGDVQRAARWALVILGAQAVSQSENRPIDPHSQIGIEGSKDQKRGETRIVTQPGTKGSGLRTAVTFQPVAGPFPSSWHALRLRLRMTKLMPCKALSCSVSRQCRE